MSGDPPLEFNFLLTAATELPLCRRSLSRFSGISVAASRRKLNSSGRVPDIADTPGPEFVGRRRAGAGLKARLAPARYKPEHGTLEVIPRDRVESGRDQFVGFDRASPFLGLAPLGFLNKNRSQARAGGGIQHPPELVDSREQNPWREHRSLLMPAMCASCVISIPLKECRAAGLPNMTLVELNISAMSGSGQIANFFGI